MIYFTILPLGGHALLFHCLSFLFTFCCFPLRETVTAISFGLSSCASSSLLLFGSWSPSSVTLLTAGAVFSKDIFKIRINVNDDIAAKEEKLSFFGVKNKLKMYCTPLLEIN